MQVKLLNAAALLLSLYNGLFSQESRLYGTEGLLEGMEDFILTDVYTELLYCKLRGKLCGILRNFSHLFKCSREIQFYLAMSTAA